MNLAIFNRTLRKFGESLIFWKKLENLQKEVYGEKSIVLFFTWKNLGTCYLGIGSSADAKKYFENCLQLLKDCPIDEDKLDVIKKDREEEASLYQNLYLVHVADRKYEEALRMCDNVIELLSEIHGERSKKLASKYHQKANCLLFLNQSQEAITNAEKAIDLHENPAPEKVAPGEAEVRLAAADKDINFSRIQYQSFLCSALFMANDFDRVDKECDKGCDLCSKYTFELLKPEAEKSAAEFRTMKLKARAKSSKTTALDLRETEDKAAAAGAPEDELKSLTSKSSFSVT